VRRLLTFRFKIKTEERQVGVGLDAVGDDGIKENYENYDYLLTEDE
jgi:hypothetical protein